MSDNESYELAEQAVLEQINDELQNEQLPEGTTVLVGDMQECDCIPTGVTDSRERRWVLESVRAVKYGLEATYRC